MRVDDGAGQGDEVCGSTPRSPTRSATWTSRRRFPTADPASAYTFAAGPGRKWGYGLLLNTTDVPGMRRAYSGAWAGLFNTHFWVEPASGVCGSTFSNFVSFGPPEALELYANFEPAVYASR